MKPTTHKIHTKQNLFRRFCQAENGGVLILVGLLIFPILIGVSAFAVDYARAQMVRDRMQMALDAAALASARRVVIPETLAQVLTGNDAENQQAAVTREANEYFDANFPNGYMGVDTSGLDVTATIRPNAAGVAEWNIDYALTGNVSVPTMMLKAVGRGNIEVGGVEARTNIQPLNPLDIVMTLDVSGSMAWRDGMGEQCRFPNNACRLPGGHTHVNSRLSGAKRAMNGLADMLNMDGIRFGLVPWDQKVNVNGAFIAGPGTVSSTDAPECYFPENVTKTDETCCGTKRVPDGTYRCRKSRWEVPDDCHSWSGCEPERVFYWDDCTRYKTVADSCSQVVFRKKSDPIACEYQSTKDRGFNNQPVTDDQIEGGYSDDRIKTTWGGVHLDDIEPTPKQEGTSCDHWGQMTFPPSNNATDPNFVGHDANGGNAVPNSTYGARTLRPIMGLTGNHNSVENNIDWQQTDGNTDGALGMQWAINTLNGAVGPTANANNRIIIHITDGQNTRFWEKPHQSSINGQDSDLRQLQLCNQAKADGVVIYTIAYNLPPAHVRTAGDNRIIDVLRKCSSEYRPSVGMASALTSHRANTENAFFFEANDAIDLANDMTEIGLGLMTTRLTR